MALLLTSMGLKGQIIDKFPSLLKKPAAENTVAFVTTAAYGDEDNPKWFDKYRDQLRQQGIEDIEDFDLRIKTENELEKALSAKDIIYVNGGNTFFLLDWVKKSGFDKALKKFLDAGKLYIGVSAGSIICSPTIETAKWKPQDENKVGLMDLTGLNLVPFLISPHFGQEKKDIVTKEASATKYPVVVLTDTQGILIQDGKITFIGEGEKLTFNNFQEG